VKLLAFRTRVLLLCDNNRWGLCLNALQLETRQAVFTPFAFFCCLLCFCVLRWLFCARVVGEPASGDVLRGKR
jgi:hypothetical protein